MTPREQFEAQFGPVSDKKWEWLKQFFNQQFTAGEWIRANVVGYRVGEQIFHPSDVEFILK